MARTYTPKEIAAEIGTNPKRFRKFLRSPIGAETLKEGFRPGKGHRYTIDANQAKRLKSRFAAWDAKGANTPEAPKPTRTRTKRASTPTAPEAVIATDSVEAPEAPAEG